MCVFNLICPKCDETENQDQPLKLVHIVKWLDGIVVVVEILKELSLNGGVKLHVIWENCFTVKIKNTCQVLGQSN